MPGISGDAVQKALSIPSVKKPRRFPSSLLLQAAGAGTESNAESKSSAPAADEAKKFVRMAQFPFTVETVLVDDDAIATFVADGRLKPGDRLIVTLDSADKKSKSVKKCETPVTVSPDGQAVSFQSDLVGASVSCGHFFQLFALLGQHQVQLGFQSVMHCSTSGVVVKPDGRLLPLPALLPVGTVKQRTVTITTVGEDSVRIQIPVWLRHHLDQLYRAPPTDSKDKTRRTPICRPIFVPSKVPLRVSSNSSQ